ncbi:MAG: transposase [Patescibacteria group bacterium]
MKKPQFENNEIYHIYNRGVEKRKIFLKDEDYFRFIHDLFEFNDIVPAGKYYIFGGLTSENRAQNLKVRKRELLVEILSFCLMPNHYHLLLRQEKDNGITKFMRKLDTGYTMYFNKINKRVGPLFQGCFKSVLIDKDSHFYYIPYYVHSNPLELIMSDWKEMGIKNIKKAEEFLDSYRWSSHLDYIGKKNFPSVISIKFLTDIWGGSQKYKLDFKKWLKDFDINTIREEIIEK